MNAWSLRRESSQQAARLAVRRLMPHEATTVIEHLRTHPRANLLLLNTVRNLEAPPLPGEAVADLVAVWRGEEILGVASLRPVLMLDAQFPEWAIEALTPQFTRLRAGLLKAVPSLAEQLWEQMTLLGFEALIDRQEDNYFLTPEAAVLASAPTNAPPTDATVRPARAADLDALVAAARGSLWEEGRPDPHDHDPEGFRAWVAGRLPGACVVETQGEIAFVGFADVRQPEGWLLQGIYTWPAQRQRGYARIGVSELCRMAFAAGAEHVQLAVVSGNAAAEALYQGLGFRRFEVLRTILFG